MKKNHILACLISGVVLILIWATTFVLIVPPIGAIPEGKTVWIFKPDRLLIKGNIDFFETPDHFQYKNMGKVTLFGRAIALASLVKSGDIILRLPYSETFESIANGGMKWGN